MRRGNNNVFKLSGNLALGGGNEYVGVDNGRGQGGYGITSNSNTMKKPSGYGQSYENTYDYNQKSGTSESRKYSRNKQQTPTTNVYPSTTNYGNSSSSAKRMEYNYQNGMNKIDSMQTYNNKVYRDGGYSTKGGSSYHQQPQSYHQQPQSYNQQPQSYNQQPQSYTNNGGYKDMYANTNSNYQNQNRNYNQKEDPNNYQPRNYNQKDSNMQYQQEYNKTRSKINQSSQQESYSNPNSRLPQKNTATYSKLPPQNKTTTQQPSRSNYDEMYPSQKEQIKEYDPSTFIMCRQGCGRKFNPDSITKHQKVCKKVFQNKRPQFNVQEQRIIAQEQKKLMKQGQIIEKKIEQKKIQQQKKQNMPKWKAQSIGFRAALKVNRKGGEMTQQEKRIINEAQQAGMVKCKFCGRSFNQKAAQRHIPFCEQQQKKNVLKKKK